MTIEMGKCSDEKVSEEWDKVEVHYVEPVAQCGPEQDRHQREGGGGDEHISQEVFVLPLHNMI